MVSLQHRCGVVAFIDSQHTDSIGMGGIIHMRTWENTARKR